MLCELISYKKPTFKLHYHAHTRMALGIRDTIIIMNQLPKVKAPSYNNFSDIPFISFAWLNLQRAITHKNQITLFLHFTR